MSLKSSSAGTARLVSSLLTPSAASSIIAAIISVAVVGGTIFLTQFGAGAQESLLGLHSVYSQSAVGANANIVGQHLSGNAFFNNAVLFVLWGSVGLMVYSVVQGIAKQLKNTGDLINIMSYIHVNKGSVIRDAVSRAAIRFAALAGWWIMVYVILRKVFPYAISSAHVTGYHLLDANSWLHTLLGLALCLVSTHALVVFLRLMVLRPRLTGNSIIDNNDN